MEQMVYSKPQKRLMINHMFGFNSIIQKLALQQDFHLHLYKISDIDSTWTPIESVAKEIRIGKNQSHLITRIQFPIQLAAARTIHRAQGLSLDDLVFNPCGVNK